MRNLKKWHWKDTALNIKERLSSNEAWFPVPAFLGFGLTMLLSSYLMLSLNPKIGNGTDILVLNTPPKKEGSIWFSLEIEKSRIKATTDDRQLFFWPITTDESNDLKLFKEYLIERTHKEAYSIARQARIEPYQTKVVIALDQMLSYAHVRPILYALAEAKITDYSFETKILLDK